MRLVIAFAGGGLVPEVQALGERCGAEFADVGGSDTAYFDLLRELWAAGESFTLLEHDILPTGNVLEEMRQCPREWCAGAYPQLKVLRSREGEVRGRLKLALDWGLGCTKFGAALLQREPDAMTRAGAISNRHWSVLDVVLMHEVLMKERGHPGPHIHLGEVRHLRVEAAYFPLEPRLDYHHRHWRRESVGP